MIKTLTCIECPIGCEINAETENGKAINITGYSCPRGKMYAESEIVCPKRVLTSTVRTEYGKPVPVKTSLPIKKSEIFNVMEIIKRTKCTLPVKIGDVLIKNVSDDADLIVSGNH